MIIITYQELLDNIRDLGFGDESDMQDFETEVKVVTNAINRSISMINLEVDPIRASYEFSLAGNETGYVYLNMEEETDDFLQFADTPVTYAEVIPYRENGELKFKEKSLFKKFNDFDFEGETTLVFNADDINKGKTGEDAEYYSTDFRIYYGAEHEKYTGTTAQKREDLPLPKRVHHLVPLLAAYYVWLEDEPTKAAQYYNMYETAKNVILEASARNKLRVRVLPGGM